MNNAPFAMLVACIGAGACWALWFYLIKEYRLSAFRERLFSIRDELFDLAADGSVAFEDPAYEELRNLINGMLRFAHRVSFLKLLTSVKTPSALGEGPNPYQRWENSLEILEPNVRTQLERIYQELFSAYMKQLVEGSAILLPTATILFAGFVLRYQLKKFFSSQATIESDVKTAMVRDLARTLNAQILEAEAYREGKNRDKLELSPA